MRNLHIKILTIEWVEALDFVDPIKVFTRAAHMHPRLQAQTQHWSEAQCGELNLAQMNFA